MIATLIGIIGLGWSIEIDFRDECGGGGRFERRLEFCAKHHQTASESTW
jgi:hypothetical protein